MDPLSIGLGAVNLGSSIFGALRSAKQERAALNSLNSQINKTQAEEDNLNEDPLDSSFAQNVLTQAKQNLISQNRDADNAAAVTGESDEANLAAKGNNQKAYTNSLANLSSYLENRNDNMRQHYDSNLMSLLGQKNQVLENGANSGATLTANGLSGLGNSLDLMGFGKSSSGSGSPTVLSNSPLDSIKTPSIGSEVDTTQLAGI